MLPDCEPSYRFPSTVVSYYQSKWSVEFHHMLVVRAEGPDAFDQHL